MAVRRPQRKQTAAELAIADRVARARRAQPPRDPTGEHHEACAAIAAAVGVDPGDVIDDWDHDAAIRQYEGNISREEAERLAVEAIRERYIKQTGLEL